MKKIIPFTTFLFCSLYCFGIRIVNDSPTEIELRTYNVGDNTYLIPERTNIIGLVASLNFSAHDQGKCKLSIWSRANGSPDQELRSPGRVFSDYAIIVIDKDSKINIIEGDGVYIRFDPTQLPRVAVNEFFQEGEGLKSGETFNYRNEYKLTLKGGSLSLINLKTRKTCWTSNTKGVEFMMFTNGFLHLYKQNPDTTHFEVIKTYGYYRPGSNLYVGLKDFGGCVIFCQKLAETGGYHPFTDWIIQGKDISRPKPCECEKDSDCVNCGKGRNKCGDENVCGKVASKN